MALRKIITDGEPALNRVAREVTKFDERLRELADDMLETMYEADGIGLAANQIAVLKRIFVMDILDEADDENTPKVFINPEITEREGEQEYLEGCLSIPGLFGYTTRPARLKLKYQDLDGVEHELEADGLRAVCICHEVDHLDGFLYKSRAHTELKPIEHYMKNGE